MENNANEGKCGHAKCAGGNGCYEKGAPMCKYKPVNMDNIYNPDICPSSLDEFGEPATPGETAHIWDTSAFPTECSECGAIKE
jgi:hypothetical protein